MQDASGSIPEAEEVTDETHSSAHLNKARSYTRCLVVICFSIWLISSLSFLGAEWLHTRQQPKYIKVVPRPPHAVTSILRASGAVSILLGISGWWGVLHERYGSIVTFSLITLLSSILEISCGAVTLSYAGKTTLLMQEDVVRNLKRVKDPSANERTDNFMELQHRLSCCGVFSYRDWIKSPWWHSQRRINSTLVVPDSCCNGKARRRCNSGEPPYTEVDDTTLVYKMGCMQKISDYMDFLFHITGGVAFICGILKLTGYFLLHKFGNMILFHQQQNQVDEPE